MQFSLSLRPQLTWPALVLLAIGLPLYVANAQSNGQSSNDLTGSWLFSFSRTAPAPAELLTLGTFGKDGTFVGTAQGDGLCCPASGPAHGAWEKTGNDTFTAKFVTIWHQADGTLFGTLTATLTLTLDKKSDEVFGQINGQLVGPGGAIIFPVSGSLVGRKIQVL